MLKRKPILVLACAAAFAACGDNFWSGLPTGSGGPSPNAPSVEISAPLDGQRIALGDSVLVTVRVHDSDAVASLELSGLSVRGDVTLGTDVEVVRYAPKKVDLRNAATADTTIARYLVATSDSISEDGVLIIVSATDANGNTGADTVVVTIGGPRVHITSPGEGAEIRAGTLLRIGVVASDAVGRVESVRVWTEGAFRADSVLTLDPGMPAVDTAVAIRVPDSASGALTLNASVLTTMNDSAVAAPVSVALVQAVRDTRAPSISYSIMAPHVAERNDSIFISVEAVDSTAVDHIGVTVVGKHPTAVALDTLRSTASAERRTFGFSLADLRVPLPVDTATLRLEITAFAVDTARNCGVATVPRNWSSESCVTVGAHTFGARNGARSEVLLVRGRTITYAQGGDVVGDLASDGRHVFVSNVSQNRVDVIPVGQYAVSRSISVGSQPWGLAFDRTGDTLYVANSGGTNVSVVSPTSLTEVRRIQTPNVKVFNIDFETGTLNVNRVTRHDYSDRPQFIAVTQNRNLIFSTRPTSAAADGTVRIYRPGVSGREGRIEMVTDYVENRPAGKLLVLNADSVFQLPDGEISVCPRRRSADPSLDGTLPLRCYDGPLGVVAEQVTADGYDTEFHFNKDVQEVGLSDTTFVAISGDHSTVAFGEGGVDHARIMILVDRAGASADEPMYKHGEITDLIGNAAERVIGLSLNQDGSLGVARGDQAYFFDRELRLQGVVETGSRAGGVDMHPDNPTQQRTFVSGITENGMAFIDVLDSYHFRPAGRIFMRDPVTGPIRAVETVSGLMLYAVTDRGIVILEVLTEDLQDS